MGSAMTSPATTPSPSPAPAIGKREVVVATAAADEIAKQAAKRGTPQARIRLGVRGGGCTGFTYVFEWADTIRPTDHTFDGTTTGGRTVGIVVDPKSLVYLGGMQLDYTRGMMGHGFKFNNPNAKGECGCGESVNF